MSNSNQSIQINQAKQELSRISGAISTDKQLKAVNAILNWFDAFPKVFFAENTVADLVDCEKQLVHEVKNRMFQHGTLDWTRNDHAPTPTYSLLMEPEKILEFKKLFRFVYGYQKISIPKNPHHIAKHILLILLFAVTHAPGVSGTPQPPTSWSWGEQHCRQNETQNTGPDENEMNYDERDAIFAETRRHDYAQKAVRPPDEAKTQKQGANPLKQEREYEQSQSSPTFHPRDYRAEPHKVGANKAVRFSPSSDSRCQKRAQSQQTGPRSIRIVFQDMFGVLPEKQHRTGMESSGYPQGSVQDAGECDDGVAGYEGDWSEVF